MKIFTPGHNWKENACINFMDDNWDLYGDGYERAIELLFEAKTTRIYHYDRDSLIYPIAFLIRHFVELRLKSIIKHLIKLRKKIDFPESHNLEKIWQTVKKSLEEFLPNTNNSLNDLEQIINEIHIVDPLSIEFRYPEKKKGKGGKSLPRQEKINYINLENAFNLLKEKLTGLSYELQEYIEIENEMKNDFY